MDQKNLDGYSCKFCEFCTTSEEELSSHMSAKHKEYKCSICQEKFFNLEEIRIHIRKSHLIKWTCQICDKSFASEAHYKSHCKVHLNIESEEDRPKICVEESQKAILEKSGESLSTTSIHKTEEILKCIFCDFTTADNDILNFHVCSHVTIEILQCGDCGVCFDQKAQLDKHKIVHKKIYYKCGVCDKKSSRKKIIMKHVSRNHIRPCKDYRYFNCSSFSLNVK